MLSVVLNRLDEFQLLDPDFDVEDMLTNYDMHPDAYVDHTVIGHRQVIERNGTWLSAASYGERHNLSYEPIPVRPKKSLVEQAIDEVLRRKYRRTAALARLEVQRRSIIYKQKLNLKRADDDWVAQGFVKQDSDWLNLAYEIAFFPHVRDDIARQTAHNWLSYGYKEGYNEGLSKDEWIWKRSLNLSKYARIF